jgi:hypothetical protein
MTVANQMISAFRVNRETNAHVWIGFMSEIISDAGGTKSGRSAFHYLRSVYLMQCDAERRRYAYSHG